MKTQFKDVAHLYLGCEGIVDITYLPKIIEKVKAVIMGYYLNQKLNLECYGKDGIRWGHSITDIDDIKNFKPILRPLSDMSEEEIIESEREYFRGDDLDSTNNISCYTASAFQTNYLLKKQFDLFGLIESGQAIDKTTLK